MRAKPSIQKKKTLFTLGLLSFLVLCGVMIQSYNRFFDEYSKLKPQEGGILTESTIGTIENLSPFSREHTLLDKDLHKLIFEGLLRYDSTKDTIIDGLAHMQVKNETTYEFTIKENARFQDGKPVTTKDVVFTFESIIQNPHFSNEVLFEAFQYTRLEVIDEKTIEFRLIEPNFYFPAFLTTPIVPSAYFENAFIEQITDPTFSFNKSPIGAGPYQLNNIVPNNDGSIRVFLTKNKHYYKKIPYIDQIVLYVYPTFEDLQSSSVTTHMYSHIPFQYRDALHNTLNERVSENKIYQHYTYQIPQFTGFFFNLDRPIPGNISIRRALDFSFDVQTILAKEPNWTPFHSYFFFLPTPYTRSGVFFNDARNILTEAGYPYDPQRGRRVGNVSKTPLTLKLITSTNPPVYSRFAQVAEQTWERELNINIDLHILSPQEFQKALSERDYDIVFYGQNYSENPNTLSSWHSSQSGLYNLSNLTNESIDFLIQEVIETGSQTDLINLHDRLLRLDPALILARPTHHLLVSSQLQGFNDRFHTKLRKHAHRYLGVSDWYFYVDQDWDLPSQNSRFGSFIRWFFGIPLS